jgi:hypothetical protein
MKSYDILKWPLKTGLIVLFLFFLNLFILYVHVLLVTTDLQFKIIMSQKNQQQQSEKRSASTNSHRSRKDESRMKSYDILKWPLKTGLIVLFLFFLNLFILYVLEFY